MTTYTVYKVEQNAITSRYFSLYRDAVKYVRQLALPLAPLVAADVNLLLVEYTSEVPNIRAAIGDPKRLIAAMKTIFGEG